MKSSNWMYVDDLTISQAIHQNSQLNPKKCQDLTASFLRVPPQKLSTSLYINTHPLEKVNCYKVLGVILQEDLKWNAHTDSDL